MFITKKNILAEDMRREVNDKETLVQKDYTMTDHTTSFPDTGV